MKHWLHFRKRGSLSLRVYDMIVVAEGTGSMAERVFRISGLMLNWPECGPLT